MRGFDHATIFSPSFHGLHKNAWRNDLPIRPKIPGGSSRKIGWGCAARFLKPLPYFRPKSVIFPTLFQTWSKIWYPISDMKPGAWPERATSCYCTYTVAGVNIKREMVLSPNDEEVANSSKKHTHIAYIRDYPPSGEGGGGEKRVADYESCCLGKRD